MPRKKSTTSHTKLRRLPKTQPHTFKTVATKKESTLTQWRWGESYTSLLLGIVVVIVGVLFGVTLVRQHKNLQETSSIQATPVIATPTISPRQITEGKKTYTVEQGDDLWHIAEKFYQSGYNWVDIAKANNLTDPGTIHVGDTLVIPVVTPEATTVTPTPTQQVAQSNSITGNSYVIQKGDDLWNIAVRAYGDGYKWVDIAKANNLSDPDLLFSGNKLTIPR